MHDLEHLLGFKLPRINDQLNELLYYVKCELSGASRTAEIRNDAELQLENVDTNRPDTWSTEGIARALRGIKGIEVGARRYSLSRKPATSILVDPNLKQIRPYIASVIAEGTKLSDPAIRSLIQLQEKLDQSYGRKRRRSSIGFYDFDLIKPPLTYGLSGPNEISFVPLDGKQPMTLRQILETHPKGIEYGHIVNVNPKMPILLDANRKVLSFPPIINSNDLGKITPETGSILVEVTGTSEETVTNTLTILAVALADRGAKLHPARIHYDYGKPSTIRTPDLHERTLEISVTAVSRLIGLALKRAEIITLLRKARYDVYKSSGNTLKVSVPCYRLDILHPVDVIEDVSTVYGLNNLKPEWPSDLTAGGLSQIDQFADQVRELMIGFGYQEIMTFMMTDPEKLYGKMNRNPSDYVEIANPKIATLTCLRSWLLPNLLEFLGNNTHVEYPQRMFEVGFCTLPYSAAPNRAEDKLKLACVSAHSQANFTEMRSNIEPFLNNLGLEFTLQPASDPSFLDGRAGSILIEGRGVGIIGEIHPQVLENWKLEDPVAAMEIDLDQLRQSLRMIVGEAPKPPTSERTN